jgi:hypothetical protein
MSRVQLNGVIRIGPVAGTLVDVSDAVSALVINTKVEMVQRPPTYGNPNKEARKGSIEDQVTLVFHADEAPSTGLWAVLYDAARNSATGELAFDAVYRAGAASASNPRFTGIFLVSDIDTGTPVNEWKAQSKTFPARSIAGPLAT